MELLHYFRYITLVAFAGATFTDRLNNGHRVRHRRQFNFYFQQNFTVGLKNDVEEFGAWGPWSQSSECSRSCGGGVSHQTRICEDIRIDGSHSCVGPSKRFISCNIQDCPEGSRDFRHEQCSSFNTLPFEGKYYSWVPYTKAPNPCELNCMPKGERFYYRHSKKVIDGTKCYDDGSRDVCVDGTCMPVGCDMLLGSEAKEDKCRTCGGDGSNCNTISGLFDLDSLQVGYNDILLIPAGATNINITEQYPTNNYLAVRNATGHFYLNGHWRIEFPRDIKFAGTTFHYERKTHAYMVPETLWALGPTTEAIYVVLLYQEKNLGISYEYSIPAGVSTILPDTYSWRFGDFEECSQQCGGGTQSRPITCVRKSDHETVQDNLCDPSNRPEKNRTCNEHPCDAKWHAADWQECIGECGKGIQFRTVTCQQQQESGISVLVDEKVCQEKEPKPDYYQKCGVNDTCPEWKTGIWSACNKACGDGFQTRQVTCEKPEGNETSEVMPDSRCEQKPKPEQTQKCNSGPCEGVDWIVSDWTGCESTCGLFLESRQSFCSTEEGRLFPGGICDQQRSPNTTRECPEVAKCDAMWHASEWSECSAKCGIGVRTRVVFCGVWEDDVIKKVGEDKCNPEKKFNAWEKCTKEPCKGQWFSGPWGKCTAPCGSGTMSRQILCIMDAEEIVSNKSCDATLRPFDKDTCNMHACDDDEVMIVGGCKDSTHGCCPDGITPAGPNLSGCPKPILPEGGCQEMEFGCCADGVIPALGPFRKGCPVVKTCNDTKFGCCPDGITPASSESKEECPEVVECEESAFGCCPDEVTPALGANFTGCELLPAADCKESTFGCCKDNTTLAEGPDFLGCDDGLPSGEEDCLESLHGCCPDGITPMQDVNGTSCPDTNFTVSIPDCHNSTYGCCGDGLTPAKGANQSGCDDDLEGSGSYELDCSGSIYGCCPDNTSIARGPDFEGCDLDNCTSSEFGCCADNVTNAKGPNLEGCEPANCTESQFGCCPDNITEALDANFGGCEVTNCSESDGCDNATTEIPVDCSEFEHGCCEDERTPAKGPNGEGCCSVTQFGCCPDDKTVAIGPNYFGCGCHTSQFGCCPDGITLARGPRYYGCTCETYPYGCCQDHYIPAQGPNYEGCICNRMLYDCCDDGITPAQGPNREGCDCRTGRYGCCPDGKTAASGPRHEGCPCQDMPFGCCPDGKTVSRGNNFEGCACSTMEYGCCPDGVTAAKADNGHGCECENAIYGCCPDRRTSAKGPGYYGCPCESLPYGCCHDQVTPARGPRYGGCPCDTSPYGCCPDGYTVALGHNHEDCDQVTPTDAKVSGEVCSLTKEPGSCHNYTVKWFFDMAYGGCSRFWYGGCEGNANRFSTQEECERVCVTADGADACLLPMVVGPCNGTYPAWHYDSLRRNCQQFEYGGCLGNNNRFPNREICEQTCIHQESIDPCEQPLVVGPCKGSFPRWHYERNRGHCKRFEYSGCKGNDNNFETEHECVQKCAALSERDVCRQPKLEGPCRGSFPRWYYSQADINCQQFVYSGCEGNKNRFITRDECEKTCNTTVPTAGPMDTCSLPKAEGPCRAAIQKWYYNTEASRCEPFYYGGCDGNANRFETRNDCENACIPREEKENVCLMPQEVGNCFEFRERWYHDSNDGICHRFYYSGCGGNENNFGSYKECEERCGRPTSTEHPEEMFKTEYCFLTQESGPCTNTDIRWYYDRKDGVCKEFYYGGCQGNSNRFRTRRECETKCGEVQDVCQLPKIRGPCSGSFTQWHYNPQSDRCQEFQYGGCQGNGNRFNDRETCEAKCKHSPSVNEVCSQPEDKGPCLGYFPQWYYESGENSCKSFIYGGCEGNANRFENRQECESRCIKKDRKPQTKEKGEGEDTSETNEDICRKPADSGQCTEVYARWFYDPEGHSCLPFVYGGCGGNKNRFKTFDMCMHFCTGTKPLEPKYDERDNEVVPVERPGGVECPENNCQELRCTFGTINEKDENGCMSCHCANPCEGHDCPEGSRCSVEVLRTDDGRIYPQLECRQVNKPGECPYFEAADQPITISRPECQDYCRDDANCRGNQKCCFNGCAHTCIEPLGAAPLTPLPQVTEHDERTTESTTVTTAEPEKEMKEVAGAEITMECYLEVSGDVPRHWEKDGRNVTSDPSQGIIKPDGSFYIRSAQPSHTGIYTCTIRTRKLPPLTFKLIIHVPVSISYGPDSVSAVPGEPALLFCHALGFPPPSVTWWRSGVRLPFRSSRYQQFNDNSLLIRAVIPQDAGPYICIAQNELGGQAQWQVIVTVGALKRKRSHVHDPKSPNVGPLNSSSSYSSYLFPVDRKSGGLQVDVRIGRESKPRVGAPMRLDCLVSEQREDITARWYHGNIPIESDEQRQVMKNNSLYLDSASLEDAGEYRCVVDSPYGEASATITVSIEDVPVPEDCNDNPRFANCELIVKARYCLNHHYGKFCCRSCLLSGQIVPPTS